MLLKISGLATFIITLLVILREAAFIPAESILPGILLIFTVMLFAPYVPKSRQIFILAGLLLSLANIFWNPNWSTTLHTGLNTAAFIAAFFTALTTLKSVAETSPAIKRCGSFLSQQPPGKRYLALTFGGQLFGLLLNYGSISLLGSIAASNAATEQNVEIRTHRIRRMLLAIQRGFISILPWSPFSFAVAISTALVPNTQWLDVIVPGLMSGLILAGTGWAMDSVFKPKLSSPLPIRQPPDDNWSALSPLFILLGLLVLLLGSAYLMTGLRIQALVMMIVPLISIAWIAHQSRNNHPVQQTKKRINHFVFEEIAGFKSEMVLLIMAGYLGTIASPVLGSLMQFLHVDLGAMPAWIVLTGIVWFIPLAGQLGMNPILAAALLAPILPAGEAIGISNTALVVALTAGWILSGVSSPFTATTLLVGKFANISSFHVGQKWNGVYTLLCAVLLSAWVIFYANYGT